ncbi:FadR/GntR family transcriptional regulator [Pseudothioclava arenosa]|uniref:GntR family transcriptional regulator n=1 Tax=Pseudothioclava arenosa TaxID=1795308 RepID=A0A2A4CPJ7_9RHOB|nr:FadR/GntR family transcriptional regulator [Pseudothioclava arenosa]PCD76172.1 GntR family transcriptional regulator [Pseudothioclava arenosa]
MSVTENTILEAGSFADVLRQLRRLVTSGEMPEDGKLPTEREMAETLGVGRRAVRRALEALESEGLVWRKQGKGTFIGQPPDPTGALAAAIAGQTRASEVAEARLYIEPALAGLCAARAKPDDVRRMRVLVERIHQTADRNAAELWDGALHRMIARTAGNRVLLTAFSLLDEIRASDVWRELREKARDPGSNELYFQQHMQLVDCIERGDVIGAEEAMRAHLNTLSERMRHAIEDSEAGDD